jgi:hypothetical protein
MTRVGLQKRFYGARRASFILAGSSGIVAEPV